jgi:hypothetical protein
MALRKLRRVVRSFMAMRLQLTRHSRYRRRFHFCCLSGIRAEIGCGSLSLTKAKKAMAVPVGPGHRSGDLGQAAEGLAVPSEPSSKIMTRSSLPFHSRTNRAHAASMRET